MVFPLLADDNRSTDKTPSVLEGGALESFVKQGLSLFAQVLASPLLHYLYYVIFLTLPFIR